MLHNNKDPELDLLNKSKSILEPCKNNLKILRRDIRKIDDQNKRDILNSMMLACNEVILEAELELPNITTVSICHVKIRLSALIHQLPKDIDHNGLINTYSRIGSFIEELDSKPKTR